MIFHRFTEYFTALEQIQFITVIVTMTLVSNAQKLFHVMFRHILDFRRIHWQRYANGALQLRNWAIQCHLLSLVFLPWAPYFCLRPQRIRKVEGELMVGPSGFHRLGFLQIRSIAEKEWEVTTFSSIYLK